MLVVIAWKNEDTWWIYDHENNCWATQHWSRIIANRTTLFPTLIFLTTTHTHLVIISNMCFLSSRGFSAGVSFRTSAMLGLGVEETLPCRLAGLRVPTRWATLDFLLPALCPSCSRARSVCPWVSVWLLIQEMNMSLNQSRENWYMTSIWARSARTKYRVAPLVATF